MTPFMQFRRWLREGPRSERVLTAAGAVFALLVVVTALVPADRDDTSVSTDETAMGGVAAGDTASQDGGVPSATTTSAPGVGPAGAPSGSGGASVTTVPSAAGGAVPSTGSVADAGTITASACDNRATDTGVSATEIRVGIILYSLGALNSALGLPPPEDSKKMWSAVFDRYNKQGGVHCRRLVPLFYEEVVLSPDVAHSECLRMREERLFAVLNNFFTFENRTCLVEAKIPNFFVGSPDPNIIAQFHPYILSYQADYDRLYRDYVFGSRQVGFFNGMAKLGILAQTCFPERVKTLRTNLAAAGIPDNKISVYDYGCASSPEQDTTAVLQFRREGVTHLMSAFRETSRSFAQAAERQNYRLKYSFPNDQFSSLLSNGDPPPSPTLDGALIITKSGEGAEYTPGAKLTPATADCAAIADAVGVPRPTNTPRRGEGPSHALACINTKMFVAAAKATRPLVRAGLARGLATVGELDLSFPAGPSVFANQANPTGGQFWRPSAYFVDCTCVRLLDQTWRPEFKS